jgi:hypothetical protein
MCKAARGGKQSATVNKTRNRKDKEKRGQRKEHA